MLWVLPFFIIVLFLYIILPKLKNKHSSIWEGKTKEIDKSDYKDKIERLNSLYKAGLITKQEFEKKKADILRRI